MTYVEFKTYVEFYYTAAWHVCEDVLPDPAPTWEYGLPGNGPMDLVADTGTLTFTLDNSEANAAALAGYYTPGHANAPAWFVDGLKVRVRCERQDDMTIATRFIGWITDITPSSGAYFERTTDVMATDWMEFASIQKLGPLALQTGAGLGVDDVLTAALVPFDVQPESTNFDVGAESFASIFNTDDAIDMTMASLFQKYARNEGGGFIYLTGAGALTFDNRNARPAMSTPSFSLNDAGETPMSELEVTWNREQIHNRIECRIWPSAVDAAATTNIWKLQKTIGLSAAQTMVLTCPYRDPDTGARISAFDLVDPLFHDGTYCTGGTVTQVGDQRIHTFTGDGTLVVANAGDIECLMVAGGGGGGKFGGGGGAGGIVYNAAMALTTGSKAVVIGAGGAGDTTENGTGGSGGNTTFNALTATGGGGGGSRNGTAGGVSGADGGCGGGGSPASVATQGLGGTASQGENGGDGPLPVPDNHGGGGGGGNAAAGESVGGDDGGDGGAGTSYSISGAAVTYAGGGGGCANLATPGAGGVGGGGDGKGTNVSGEAGDANTGGGGGGSGPSGAAGGAGGSGIVIVSYTYTVIPYYNVKFGSVDDGSTNDKIDHLTATQDIGGNTCVVTLVAAEAGYVNFLELYGKGIYTYDPLVVFEEDATSITARGERVLDVSLEQVSNPNTAESLAALLLAEWKDPKLRVGRVRFLANTTDDLATAALTVEPNTRFGIAEALTDTLSHYHACRLSFQAQGPLLWVDIVPAPASDLVYFIYDDATLEPVSGHHVHGWDHGVLAF